VALLQMSSATMCPFSTRASPPATMDVVRAANKPGDSYRGDSFSKMNKVLNEHLSAMDVKTLDCNNFTAMELQKKVLEPIFARASPELLTIYALYKDPRQRLETSLADIRKTWDRINGHVARQPWLHEVQRDGLCHEAVMWFVHHLSECDRTVLSTKLTLPALPMHRHTSETIDPSVPHSEVYADYESKVSCQQCHTGPVSAKWVNATLPPPLPVDSKHPGRERERACDYQNQPSCGPCEGLGGPRTGDGAEEFTPLNCTVVSQPHEVPLSSRVPGRFPNMGHAQIDGDTRSPLAVRPDPAKPGSYPKVSSSISLAWDAQMARHRYDFQSLPPLGSPASQIYLQTAAQMKSRNSSGVMVTIIGSQEKLSVCICMDGIAGAMHVDSFVPNTPDDPVDLPAEEGGLAYLGRVKLAPIDGGNNNTVIADHYLKWAFHFLVDADPASPSYGMPMRLYGATGVRFIYSNWTQEDPRTQNPKLFEIPKWCVPLSKTCREMRGDPQ